MGAWQPPSAGSRPVPIGSRFIGVSLHSSAGCSPAEPASASPVTDNSSPNPIQRANQIALLNSTAGCRQTRAPRPNGECHLYFARRVTFLSCADTDVERTSSICGNDLPKLTNSTSMSRAAKQSGQLLLNHREQHHHARGDNRERIASARQAAEALFTPKPQAVEPLASDPVPSATRPTRKPRVLAILSPAPVRNEEVAAPVDPEPRTTRQIPRSHHAPIRTWVNYGLTTSQVAEVYGVAVGVIERILRRG
jgi:hypothetical protein